MRLKSTLVTAVSAVLIAGVALVSSASARQPRRGRHPGEWLRAIVHRTGDDRIRPAGRQFRRM